MNKALTGERPEEEAAGDAITLERAPADGTPPINARMARLLRDAADLIEAQGGDGFRERAYRAAATTIGALARPVDEILAAEGRAGLHALPTIGSGIAAAIAEFVVSGRWSRLDRLRGLHDPARLFRTVPGIGATLARRFADELGLETLGELERALHSPEVRVRGLGPRRRETALAALAARLGHPPPLPPGPTRPSEALVLEIDAAYRAAAAEDALARASPERSAETMVECVPVMHRHRNGWDFTAMYSHTLHAVEAGKTHDWVIVHFHRDGLPEGRCTVIGDARDAPPGRRVVLGLDG